MKSKLRSLALILTGAILFALIQPAMSAPEHPHLVEAMAHLKAARAELLTANENKGGHRGTALKYIAGAIAEVEACYGFRDAVR